MTQVVWKYPFAPITDRLIVEMPAGTEVLAFDNQRETPTLWALVDPEGDERETRQFVLYGTGHQSNGRALRHIGTALFAEGALVLHCFEDRT